ncbi:MAG: class I SAM-dependent methyltransferase [Nitrospinota bacterium]
MPVRFPTLEEELHPALKYLTGNVLNAGCGNRDVSEFLLRHNATSVDNCDLETSIPNAIICDIADIPRDDEYYDAIFCIAVLEHVHSPERALNEFDRVLKPGGHLVISVPFLQPFHPRPADYRRYTRDGLAMLAETNNFELVASRPLFALAHTITWIIWEYLVEKKKHFLKALLWLPFYFWTRLSTRTDYSLQNNANSYQIILKKRS